MTFIITSPCIDLMDKACVDVCPVDCIYEAEELNQLVINPEECIDCAACEPVCPVDAIFPDDEVPESEKNYIKEAADYDYDRDIDLLVTNFSTETNTLYENIGGAQFLDRSRDLGLHEDTWLPLGLKVLKKIEQIVREEQNKIGAQELLMPTIQSADIWKESGRYDEYGEEMLRIKDRQGKEMLYGPTNEAVSYTHLTLPTKA